jgi:hypothetical protein
VTFAVNTNANSLAANTYSATITFMSGSGQSIQRTATLTVNPPALQVAPATGITASGQQGGPFSPTSFSYSLSATGGSLKYSITNLPTWLTVSPASGTLTTKATTVTFKIATAAADKLAASTYVGSINFNSTTNSQGNTTRVATLTVAPKQYTVAVSASPSADGTVGGGGAFLGGSSQTVTATPNGTHSHAQRHPQLRPLDPEREGGQHVGELHVHAQREHHPGGRFQVKSRPGGYA